MKRIVGAVAGLCGGLVLTWLCLYILSRLDLPHWGTDGGCSDIEHCSTSWFDKASMLVYLAPTIATTVAGYRAAVRSWTARKTAAVLGVIAASTVLAAVVVYTR